MPYIILRKPKSGVDTEQIFHAGNKRLANIYPSLPVAKHIVDRKNKRSHAYVYSVAELVYQNQQ